MSDDVNTDRVTVLENRMIDVMTDLAVKTEALSDLRFKLGEHQTALDEITTALRETYRVIKAHDAVLTKGKDRDKAVNQVFRDVHDTCRGLMEGLDAIHARVTNLEAGQ